MPEILVDFWHSLEIGITLTNKKNIILAAQFRNIYTTPDAHVRLSFPIFRSAKVPHQNVAVFWWKETSNRWVKAMNVAIKGLAGIWTSIAIWTGVHFLVSYVKILIYDICVYVHLHKHIDIYIYQLWIVIYIYK